MKKNLETILSLKDEVGTPFPQLVSYLNWGKG